MLDEAIRTIPDFSRVRLANELKHCIIAHHGELEYGSTEKTGACGGGSVESCG